MGGIRCRLFGALDGSWVAAALLPIARLKPRLYRPRPTRTRPLACCLALAQPSTQAGFTMGRPLITAYRYLGRVGSAERQHVSGGWQNCFVRGRVAGSWAEPKAAAGWAVARITYRTAQPSGLYSLGCADAAVGDHCCDSRLQRQLACTRRLPPACRRLQVRHSGRQQPDALSKRAGSQGRQL